MSSLTKAFIVLTLVFSVALAVLMVMEVGRMANYKENLLAAHQEAFAAQAGLEAARTDLMAREAELQRSQAQVAQVTAEKETAVGSLQTQIALLTTQNQTLESKNAQLTAGNTQSLAVIDSLNQQEAAKDAEITKIRPEIVSLTQQNAELNRVNAEVQNQNRAAEQAIRKLQEAVANNTGGSAAVDTTNGQVVQATPAAPAQAVNGRITQIGQSAGHTLIETKLGSSSGVSLNSKFIIYRQNGAQQTWIADAVVSNVSDDQSVATVTTTNGGQQPQQGDLVVTAPAKK